MEIYKNLIKYYNLIRNNVTLIGSSQNSVDEDLSLLGCYTTFSKNTSVSNKLAASIFRALALQAESFGPCKPTR